MSGAAVGAKPMATVVGKFAVALGPLIRALGGEWSAGRAGSRARPDSELHRNELPVAPLSGGAADVEREHGERLCSRDDLGEGNARSVRREAWFVLVSRPIEPLNRRFPLRQRLAAPNRHLPARWKPPRPAQPAELHAITFTGTTVVNGPYSSIV